MKDKCILLNGDSTITQKEIDIKISDFVHNRFKDEAQEPDMLEHIAECEYCAHRIEEEIETIRLFNIGFAYSNLIQSYKNEKWENVIECVEQMEDYGYSRLVWNVSGILEDAYNRKKTIDINLLTQYREYLIDVERNKDYQKAFIKLVTEDSFSLHKSVLTDLVKYLLIKCIAQNQYEKILKFDRFDKILTSNIIRLKTIQDAIEEQGTLYTKNDDFIEALICFRLLNILDPKNKNMVSKIMTILIENFKLKVFIDGAESNDMTIEKDYLSIILNENFPIKHKALVIEVNGIILFENLFQPFELGEEKEAGASFEVSEESKEENNIITFPLHRHKRLEYFIVFDGNFGIAKIHIDIFKGIINA